MSPYPLPRYLIALTYDYQSNHASGRHSQRPYRHDRSFLLASLQNFLRTEQRRERTVKRGELCTFVSLDAQAAERRYLFEPADDRALTVEQLFDARWAVTLLNRAMANVRAQYVARGKQRIFETLKEFLPSGGSGDAATYPEAKKIEQKVAKKN